MTSNNIEYPQTKLLLSMLGQRQSYRTPLLSTSEIFCGPDCQTVSNNGIVNSLATSSGVYDIRDVLNAIPISQYPEILLVKADATRRNFPVHLETFKGPKVLVVGNTQHLEQPVRTLIQYAVQEKFDFIVSDHKGHHLHYFAEAGFHNICFIPALNITPYPQKLSKKKQYPVSFVGQIGRFHPYRAHILRKLKKDNLPLTMQQVSSQQAAEIYANSLINLNISLNGDMNLRVFEVLSSGGFLITDRLAPESGLFKFFTENEHFVMFDNYDDLQEKLDHYLHHPEEAKLIAQQGHDQFWKNHSPENKAITLINYIQSGIIDPLYSLAYDFRASMRKHQIINGPDLLSRISVYEYFQELHLNNPGLLVEYWPGVDADILLDLIDLPRLFIKPTNATAIHPTTTKEKEERLQHIQQDRYQKSQSTEQGNLRVLIMPQTEFLTVNLESLLKKELFHSIVITNISDQHLFNPEHEYNQLLIQLGFSLISSDPVIYQWINPIKWGEYLFSEGHLSEARHHFERILEKEPAKHEVMNNLGVIAYNENDLDEAERLFSLALSYDRRNINYLTNYAGVLLEKQQYNQASHYLQELEIMDPDNSDVLFKYGRCLYETGHFNQALAKAERLTAITSSRQALQLKQDILDALAQQSIVQVQKHQNEKLKILIINNLYPPQELGGYGRLLYDFTSLLADRGHQVYVLTSNTEYLGIAPPSESGVDRSLKLFGHWKNGRTESLEDQEEIRSIILGNIARLQHVVAEYQPNCILLGNIDFLSIYMLEELLRFSLPVIHHVGMGNPGYLPNQTPTSPLYHLAGASDWVLKNMKKDGYVFPGSSVVYPGAKTSDFFMHSPPSYQSLRIAYASIVLPYKGPHFLVEALRLLYLEGLDFTCELAGSSTDQNFVDQLKNYAISAGFGDRVKFLGLLNRAELQQLFGRSNMLVFPTVVNEAFGISQVEAMSSGIVVITSGTGGAKEIIQHQQSGIIFKSEDAKSLAEEIKKLALHKEHWQNLAKAGQKRAIEHFDIKTSVLQLEAQFFKMIK